MVRAKEAHHIETFVESPPLYQARVSLLRSSPALILIVIAIADIQRWADPDLWGHLAFGRAIIAARHLAFHDPYSYSAPGHLWLNHEWLSELLMGAIYNFGGVIGLKLMKFACCAAVIVALALALAETEAPMTLQLAILVSVGIAIAPQMQFRPQLFTFAMTGGLLAILARYTYRGAAPILAVIPMLWLWANLHGGFIVGVGVLGTFSAVRMLTDLRGGRGPWVGVRLLAIVVASTLVTVITPYRLDTWHAVTHAMMNPHTREVISDWQPLLRSTVATWHANHVAVIPTVVAIAMFVALAVAFVLNPRRGDLAMVAVAAVMIVTAFLAMRNLPLAVMAVAIALARHASPHLSTARLHRPKRLNQIVIAMAGTALLIGTGLMSRTLRAGSAKPIGAVNFMRLKHLSGNVMSDFGWGEYLIWHLARSSKVFIDGRYDTVYPPNVIDDYLAFHFGDADAKDFLRKYPHDFVLLTPSNQAALEVMESAPVWKQIYRDGSCILFTRANSEAAKVSAVEVLAQETPPSYFP